MDIIIKNGIIVDAVDMYKADIAIVNEKVYQIGKDLKGDEKTKVIDATGKYVLPGIIDAHVHFQLPMAGTVSNDDFENGSMAGACGGVTTIVDYATQETGKSLLDAVEARKEEAKDKLAIDYAFHAGITDWNIAKHEVGTVFDDGISSFKMFMTYATRGLMSNDAEIFEALEVVGKKGGVICVHAESSPLVDFLVERYHSKKEKYGAYAHVLSRPDIIEIDAVERAIKLADLSKGNLYIVHMTTGDAVKAVKKARERNINVYAETCPQYLLLDDEVFKGEDGHLYTTCPQIKSKENQRALWKLLENGDIHVLATDTCTFSKKQKDLWEGDFTKLPFGLPGVETLFPTMYTSAVGSGKISLNHLVKMLCYNPAKIYGLYPQKGTLVVGSDADINIFDVEKEVIIDYRKLQTNCDWSPYQGMKLKGYPVLTMSRGKIIAENGKFIGDLGHGKFLKRDVTQTLR